MVMQFCKIINKWISGAGDSVLLEVYFILTYGHESGLLFLFLFCVGIAETCVGEQWKKRWNLAKKIKSNIVANIWSVWFLFFFSINSQNKSIISFKPMEKIGHLCISSLYMFSGCRKCTLWHRFLSNYWHIWGLIQHRQL